jgi:uncharacterized protein DUF4907
MKRMILPFALVICVSQLSHSSASLFPSPRIYNQKFLKGSTGSIVFNYPFQDEKKKTGQYTIKLVPADAGTYGYEIYSDKKLLIKQINIPGQAGVKGFKRKTDAQKVANLVVEKLSKGMMPPTVEKSEMVKLHVQL